MRFARSDPGRELQARLTRQSMAVRRLELPSGLRLGAAGGGGLSCVRETMDHGLRRCVWAVVRYCRYEILDAARGTTGGILVLDTFLGWTLVGWVAALIWAAAGVRAVGHSGAMRVWGPARNRSRRTRN